MRNVYTVEAAQLAVHIDNLRSAKDRADKDCRTMIYEQGLDGESIYLTRNHKLQELLSNEIQFCNARLSEALDKLP